MPGGRWPVVRGTGAKPSALAEPAVDGLAARRSCRPTRLSLPQPPDDHARSLPCRKAALRLLSQAGPRVGTGTLPDGRPGHEPRPMDVKRAAARGREAPRRRPHPHQARNQVPPGAARLELERAVGCAQPDAHSAGEMELGPWALARSDAYRARREAPQPLPLVEAPRHGGNRVSSDITEGCRNVDSLGRFSVLR